MSVKILERFVFKEYAGTRYSDILKDGPTFFATDGRMMAISNLEPGWEYRASSPTKLNGELVDMNWRKALPREEDEAIILNCDRKSLLAACSFIEAAAKADGKRKGNHELGTKAVIEVRCGDVYPMLTLVLEGGCGQCAQIPMVWERSDELPRTSRGINAYCLDVKRLETCVKAVYDAGAMANRVRLVFTRDSNKPCQIWGHSPSLFKCILSPIRMDD